MLEIEAPIFVKKDHITAQLEQIIDSEVSARSKESLKTTFNPNTITECSRKLIYRVMGDGKQKESASYLKTTSDIYTKKKWQEYFSKFKSIKLLESDLVVGDCNYNMSGTIDAVISVNDVIFAVKIFPVNEDRFLTVKKRGASKKDVIETIIYMWLAELKHGLAIYENENTHEYELFDIEPYKPIIMAVKSKCLTLSECKIKGEIPGKPYKVKTAKECKCCEFLNKCWREE